MVGMNGRVICSRNTGLIFSSHCPSAIFSHLLIYSKLDGMQKKLLESSFFSVSAHEMIFGGEIIVKSELGLFENFVFGISRKCGDESDGRCRS